MKTHSYIFRIFIVLSLSTSAIRCTSNTAQAVDLVGYVPYYRLSNSNYLNNILPDQLALLDEVRYFGLSVDGSGEITSLSGSVNSQKTNIATIKGMIEALPISQRPRLDITLGGAGVDAVFSSVAANTSFSANLAQNIDALLTETGATSIDIDWEHPDAGAERSTLYPNLLKRIKQEVGSNNRVYATVAPSVVISNSVLSGPDAIDGISLMTYDIGWWGGDPNNPNDGEHSLHEYVEDTIDAWTDPTSANSERPWVWTNSSWGNNTSADMLGIGLPFYGRGVFSNNAFAFHELASGGSTTDGEYYSFNGQSVWIPGQSTIEQRIQLAHDEGLQHVFIWEMAHDLDPGNPNSMLRIAANKNASLESLPGDYNDDGVVDAADYTVWLSNLGASAGTLPNDIDGGDIGQAQYLTWKTNYDTTDFTETPQAIPEPACLTLIGVSLLLLCLQPIRGFARR